MPEQDPYKQAVLELLKKSFRVRLEDGTFIEVFLTGDVQDTLTQIADIHTDQLKALSDKLSG